MYLLLRRKVGQHKIHRGVGTLLFGFGQGGFAPAPVAADHHDARSHFDQFHGRSLAYARRSTRDQANLLAHAAFHEFPPSLVWRSSACLARLRQIWLFYALDEIISLLVSLVYICFVKIGNERRWIESFHNEPHGKSHLPSEYGECPN